MGILRFVRENKRFSSFSRSVKRDRWESTMMTSEDKRVVWPGDSRMMAGLSTDGRILAASP